MNYSELRTALSAYMKRADPETINNEPIALELARLTVGSTFHPREAEKTIAALPITAGAGALPADFGMALAVGDDMAYLPPRSWQLLEGQGEADDLTGQYTILAGQLLVHPAITSLRLSYFEQPKIIAGAESNWLSAYYAQVWLHAARAEQYRFIEDMESAGVADAYWQQLAGVLAGASETTRRAGGALRMRGR
jgi:hypothetical protein